MEEKIAKAVELRAIESKLAAQIARVENGFGAKLQKVLGLVLSYESRDDLLAEPVKIFLELTQKIKATILEVDNDSTGHDQRGADVDNAERGVTGNNGREASSSG
jgi:hypothetical protein